MRRARDAGVPLSSMTALFFETVPCPILGVTGTNGKFTVVHLAATMLARSGRRTFVSGNDRTHVPILYRLPEVTPEAILVLEISNRQLLGLPYSPHIAVVTNGARHHLDDHGSFEAYAETNRKILAHHGPADWAILNGDDPTTRAFARTCAAHVLFYSRIREVDEGACIVNGHIVVRLGGREERVCEAVLQVPGEHTLENALAATAGPGSPVPLPSRSAPSCAGLVGFPTGCGSPQKWTAYATTRTLSPRIPRRRRRRFGRSTALSS